MDMRTCYVHLTYAHFALFIHKERFPVIDKYQRPRMLGRQLEDLL